MSKRNPKKRKSIPKQVGKASHVSGAGKRAGKAASTAPPRTVKSQRALLTLAVLLIAVAVFVNFQRLRGRAMPVAVPLPDGALIARPLAAPSQSEGDARFSKLTLEQTGITFAHSIIEDHPQAYLYYSSQASGGMSVGDVSGDGRPDIFIASGPAGNRLYVQTDTDFEFADVTAKSGLAKASTGGRSHWSCGATMVDINADGRLDIFVANYDTPNQLFVNLGDGSFKEQAREYGLNMTDASMEGAFADYDRDGDLDMYLLTYRYENPNGRPMSPPLVSKNGQRAIHPDFEKYYVATDDRLGYSTVGRCDGLLRNNGDGTFTNVTAEAGIYGPGHGQSVTWWDYDKDGFVDIHVGNDFNDADRLYHNNGDGTFTDVVRTSMPHVTWFSMGADFGDLNGDGLPDLFSTDMSSTTHFKQKTTMGSMGGNVEMLANANPRQYMRNALLLNTGTSRFQEAAYVAGLDSTDWTWAVKLADLDCDGMLDAFFTNGGVRSFTDSDFAVTLSERGGKTEWDIYKDTEPLREKNLVFQNQGNLSFVDQSKAWGLDHLGVSMASALGDLDGDGDLDLIVANVDEPISVYRNDSVEGRRITVRLHGRGQNRFGVGSKVQATTRSGNQFAELQPTRGFLSSNQPMVHFGLGDENSVDLSVTWPDGSEQEFPGLSTDFHYEITQAADLPRKPATPQEVTPLFDTASAATELTHVENDFEDYALQPLLPHRMSSLGPALAAGDANSDGRMDLFVGGASGQPGRIALWSEVEQEYVVSKQPALVSDQAAEDMGAVWLDVDQDGDADLFIVSGGNEHSADSKLYQPRLYLNDGKGVLVAAKDRLPNMRVSAGPVAAADFDLDGDTDLFVGGRQIPGKYPLAASSYLLINEQGKFVDRTAAHFGKSLDALGMVTGALWSDVDNDADLDLLVTMEWDSVRLFRNESGVLRDDSAYAQLIGYRGWWTGISAGDFDHDGDVDYVATNLGLNTKYHASDAKPFRIYYGDFEGDGNPKLVEAEYEEENLFPVRGKSCSTHAMPSLARKFSSFKGFAAATLQEIYTPKSLGEAYQCSANFLQSAVLINDGTGRFDIKALPTEAQLSPGFGTAVSDFDGDGHLDVFMAQNFFSPQPETGAMDGGLGCFLRGGGDATFVVGPRQQSGIVIPQDAMAAVISSGRNVPDLCVSINNEEMRKLVHKSQSASTCVRFPGVTSSSDVSGARVEVRFEDGTSQVHEINSGSGYLSQQPPIVYFSNTAGQRGSISTTFGGKETVTTFEATQREISLDF